MRYKLVIFDFDGTLADSFPWFVGVVNSVADAYKFKRIERDEVETLRGYSARRIVEHLGVPWWKMPLIGRRMRALAAEQIDQIALFEGVDRLFERLTEAGVTIAIVSSNAEANVRRVLGPINAARVTCYACGVSIFGKRASFQRILRQSTVAPRDALCIGDELRDLEAATKAGIPFGAVAWGFTRIEAFESHAPAEVLMRLDDIVERIVGQA